MISPTKNRFICWPCDIGRDLTISSLNNIFNIEIATNPTQAYTITNIGTPLIFEAPYQFMSVIDLISVKAI